MGNVERNLVLAIVDNPAPIGVGPWIGHIGGKGGSVRCKIDKLITQGNSLHGITDQPSKR